MIIQAKKEENLTLSHLILNAIGTVANTLTGEHEKNKILETLNFYTNMDYNRLSYKNIWIYEEEKKVIGLIIAYDSNQADKLDKPLIEHLATKGLRVKAFDKECFEDEFYIDTISVSSDFQRQGIGKKLMNFVEKKAKNLKFKKLSLLVDYDNHDALKLYEKIGFKKNTTLILSNHNYHHMIKSI